MERREFMKKIFALAAAAILSTSTAALAVGPGTYTNTFPTPDGTFAVLDFNDVLSLPKYDGVDPLVAIILTLEAEVKSDVAFENLNDTQRNIRVRVAGTGSLSRPAPLVGTLVTTLPALDQFFLTPAFDGVNDFDGASGETLPTISALDSDFVFIAPGDFGIFTGAGNVSLPYSLTADSLVSGGGNIASQINTVGRLKATVTYVIPEPSALGLLAPAGLMLARRRRA
jgi:hypothetical protein